MINMLQGWRNRAALIGAAVALAAAALASPAGAVSGAQATDIAYWESVAICPHYSGGVCISRRSGWSSGRGGGAWNAQAEGWERGWWEPWITSRVSARWYYKECFIITAGGSVTNRYWC
jgi:hypothetical protein